jgi:HlyD family secretion protein
MRFITGRVMIGLFTIAIIAAMGLYFANYNSAGPQETGPEFKEVQVEYGTFQVVVTANGVVQPMDRIEIKSKASGLIEELPVEEGDFVHKGQLIARLDQKDERTALAQAQADLDIARAELKQAKRTFDRRKELFERDLVSREELDESEQNSAVAQGRLVRAQTVLDRAKERLSESIVRAPIDGIILKKSVEQGQIIASGVTNVSGGTPIVDIADMRSVYVEAGIDEIDIGKVQIEQSATVVAEAYPELQFNGEVVRIAPEAKIEQNVTLFNVVIAVENTDGKLKSGMNTTIQITIVNKEHVLLAPAVALQVSSEPGDRSKTRTVLLKQGSQFVPHQVEIGMSNFKQAEILSGLKQGDILGVPMTSRLKEENERLEDRIRSSRSFGRAKDQTRR